MIEVKFSETTFKLDLKLPLEQIAEVVKQGVEQNLQGQKTYMGTPATPLELSTIRSKKSKGQPLRIFEATGKLLKSVFRKKLGEKEWMVSITPGRHYIMSVLQIEGVGRKRTKRPAVGISQDVLKQVDSLLSKSEMKVK